MSIMQDERLQGFRLSPQQLRLWRLQEAATGAAFRVQCTLRIEGDLDADRLRDAVRKVASRWEILRTAFRRLEGMLVPLQVVCDELAPELETVGSIAELLERDRLAPFDSREGSPLRLRLAPLGPGLHLLGITVPGLCIDRVGMSHLVREIALAYAGEPDGEEDDGAPQYADLAEWLNDLLVAEETRAGRDFWRRQSFAPALSARFPWESGEPDGRVHSIPVPVGPLLGAAVESFCRDRQTAPESLLLAVWSHLLDRWSSGESPAVAVACNGRKYRELQGVIGLLARYLPVHARPSAGADLAAAALAAEEAVREAHRWQESFDWAESGKEFFSWGFDFAESPESLAAGGLTWTTERLDDRLERFRAHLSGSRRGDGLSLTLHTDAGCMLAGDAGRLAAQLLAVLERALCEPAAPLGEVPVLGEAEARELLAGFHESRELPARPVHELFEEASRRSPEALALVDEERQITYGELDRLADRLAGRLGRMGVGPEVRVALCADRTADLVIGLLAILKAGGAYVPLEPSQPAARLALLLEEVAPPVLLTQKSLISGLPQGSWQVVCLDGDAAPADPEIRERRAGGVTAENLAYVLFTSGSTGTPKGVAVEHRQLYNYILAVGERLELPPGAAFATVSTFAADLGHTMVFPALCGGGCLHVVSQRRARDPEALADYFSRHRIDCLKVVPSHLAALLEGASAEKSLPRERLVLGGEPTRPALFRRIRELAGGCRVFNHYGPTETTVGVLTYSMGERWDARWSTLPLGRPIPNARVYLLDPALQPVPFWMPGEVYIGGAGVARGYQGQPAWTAERFLPDPFSGIPGARLYRTGDLARHLPDDGIEFLGRTDHQVKIRGFRVELGEIEARLREQAGVREAVVLARTEASGDSRLIAYAVPAPGASVEAADLREPLARALPDYMVPSAFVLLPALPLTPNGKLDRQALPEPAPASGPADRASAMPRTQIEELLAGIWARLLKRESVGIHDSFFALGGHSLLATQLFSRVQEAFRVELPLHLLFEDPTVAALAGKIEGALRSGVGLSAPEIVPVPRDGNLRLSFAQQRHWFLHQMDPESPLYNIRSAVRLQGRLDTAALERGVRTILDRHEILRTVFPAVDGLPVQVILPTLPFHLPVVDLRALPADTRRETAERLLFEHGNRPFDLARDPLLRMTLLRLEDEEHMVALTMHHIVADGWSMGVLVSELAEIYAAFVADLPSPLPPLRVQYPDFSEWQRSWLQGEVLEAYLSHWKRRLAGAPPRLDLPTDWPRPVSPGLSSRRHPLAIPGELSEELKELGRNEGATLFQTLLAAFQVLLYSYTEQTDIVVGAPIANRNRLETEGLIGCFINALALRTDLAGNPTFRELLGRVVTVVLEAYTYQDLPFDKLVEEIKPERTAGRTPLFQVVFSFGNTPRSEVSLAGLTLSALAADSQLEAKYDMILVLSDTREGIRGSLTYNRALFRGSTVARMASRFEALLHGIVARPDATLQELVIESSDQEKKQNLTRAEELLQRGRQRLLGAGRRTARGISGR